MRDNVNHPEHYGSGAYEVIKVIEAWGLDKDFCLGNAIKYIARAGKKEGNSTEQDLRKAKWYITRALHRFTSEKPIEESEYYEYKCDCDKHESDVALTTIKSFCDDIINGKVFCNVDKGAALMAISEFIEKVQNEDTK